MDKKFEELLSAVKLNDVLRHKHAEKKDNPYTVILVIVGAIALIAAVAYAVYYFFVPDRIVDFEDEFDEDYSDELFDDGELEAEAVSADEEMKEEN